MKRRARPLLGTLVEIGIADDLDEQTINHVCEIAFQSIETVHRLMSFHDSESDITRINLATPGQQVQVHPDTLEVLACALLMENESNGLFNAGVAPLLVELGKLPAPSADQPSISTLKSQIELLDTAVCKKKPGWLDLGGIAKGHAVDKASESLLKLGVRAFVVNAGGDMRTHGIKDLPVTIRDPLDPGQGALVVQLTNEALATSACYFSDALVDAGTCKQLSLRHSVSVAASSCMVADALTKIMACSGQTDHPILNRFNAKALIV